jgi:hypothetical protein
VTTLFLLRDMGVDLRRAVVKEARSRKLPLNEVIREILCAYYRLGCTPIVGKQRKDVWRKDNTTMLLELQPELFHAIKSDAQVSFRSMRQCILDALEDHYDREVAA